MAEKTIEQLTKELAALTKENEALKKELEDASGVVTALKEQLSDNGTGVLTVKVGKEKFKVVGGGFHGGKPYTKQQIAADAKVARELVKKGSGLLIKIK